MLKMKYFAAVTAMALSFGLGAGSSLAGGNLVVSNWDAYSPPDLMERFTEATGYGAEMSLHATNEEIMGKVIASGGKGYDVLFVSSPFAEALNELGLIAEIDHSLVGNLANLYPEARSLEYDSGNIFSVPYAWGTTGLCYRPDLVSGTPDSWDDLLNPADDLKGKVTMLGTDRWLLAAGFLNAGYSINETDQGKLDQVRDSLITAKQNLLSYDDTTFYAKLVSGEASLVHAWDGWCNFGIYENPDIKYIIPKEGTDLWVDTMVISAASENKDAAHAFINFVLTAEVGNWVVENVFYKVPNKVTMDALDPSMIETFPNIGFAPADMVQYEMLRDVGEAQKAYTQAVSEIMAAQ